MIVKKIKKKNDTETKTRMSLYLLVNKKCYLSHRNQARNCSHASDPFSPHKTKVEPNILTEEKL